VRDRHRHVLVGAVALVTRDEVGAADRPERVEDALVAHAGVAKRLDQERLTHR
jgi:hypothetical protein